MQAQQQAAAGPAGGEQGAAGAAGAPRALRPAPAAAMRPQQFHVPYRLSSKAGAAGPTAAAAAEGASTQGLLLPAPQFSLQQLGA